MTKLLLVLLLSNAVLPVMASGKGKGAQGSASSSKTRSDSFEEYSGSENDDESSLDGLEDGLEQLGVNENGKEQAPTLTLVAASGKKVVGGVAKAQQMLEDARRDGCEQARQEYEDPSFELAGKRYYIPDVLVSPGILPVLTKLIHDTQGGIDAYCYNFAFYPIAAALVGRHNNKVPVDMVIDHNFANNPCEGVRHMVNNGIAVHCSTVVDQDSVIYGKVYEEMHHKVFILKNTVNGLTLVLHGSCNGTGSADKRNWEDMQIDSHPRLVQKYQERFAQIKPFSRAIKLDELTHGASSSTSAGLNEIPVDVLLNADVRNKINTDTRERAKYDKWVAGVQKRQAILDRQQRELVATQQLKARVQERIAVKNNGASSSSAVQTAKK